MFNCIWLQGQFGFTWIQIFKPFLEPLNGEFGCCIIAGICRRLPKNHIIVEQPYHPQALLKPFQCMNVLKAKFG